MKSIFINVHTGVDWILRFLAQDIQKSVSNMGYVCHIGDFQDYAGEDIYFDYLYNSAVPMKGAKHNSLFYTHVNLRVNERHILMSHKDKFDSFICMSPEDAEFLIELGFDKNKVYGRSLPVRNTYIKPVNIGIFSSCYPDGVKNERWLIEYCTLHSRAQLANFVFIGRDWGKVVCALNELGCSSTWCNITRSMPFEYQFQQNILGQLDYYIYMGMDGGAMGTYDAYAQGVPLCVTFDGFHKAIPELDYCFDDKAGFFEQMDSILQKQEKRLDFFRLNAPDNYVKWLLDVWDGSCRMDINDRDKECISFSNVVEKKRSQYYKMRPSTFLHFLRRKFFLVRKYFKYSR